MANDKRAKPVRKSFEAPTSESPQQRRSRRQNRGEANPADWGSVSPEAMFRAISAVTAKRCAIRFGYTMDGGAYAVGILGDGEPYTDYIRPTEDIDEYLRGLAEDFENS